MLNLWRAAKAVLVDESGGCAPIPPELGTGILTLIGLAALVVFLATGSWVWG